MLHRRLLPRVIPWNGSPTMQLPKTMEGSYEQAFPEIVKFIDKNYRTIKSKIRRAIAGFVYGWFPFFAYFQAIS